MRTIKVCAGIGDNIWLLQKLINTAERFVFQLPDGKPQRGHQIFDLLPQVAESSSYIPGLTYRTLAKSTEAGKWHKIKKNEFYLSCNTWLESGKKLKDWMPDLPLSYKLPWVVPATELPKGKFIGIYGSAYSMQRAWQQYGAWGVNEWIELIELIRQHNKGYTFVIIGAEWDTDFATELCSYLTKNKIKFINTVGEPLPLVMNWMQHLHYAFYFPSGLPILSESIDGGSDCVMFYTKNIKNILGTWADPERIESGKIKECLFTSPDRIFDWCIENDKL